MAPRAGVRHGLNEAERRYAQEKDERLQRFLDGRETA
jgi:hypothetical protein